MNQRRVESLKTNPLRYATALEGFHVAVLTMEGISYEDTACPKPRFKLAARGTLADARLFCYKLWEPPTPSKKPCILQGIFQNQQSFGIL